jgi:hypothetical protein
MLLAWNYQNSAAVRNGTSGPDLATMSNLWEQYQNALGISAVNKSNEAGSPVSDLFPLFRLRNCKRFIKSGAEKNAIKMSMTKASHVKSLSLSLSLSTALLFIHFVSRRRTVRRM